MTELKCTTRSDDKLNLKPCFEAGFLGTMDYAQSLSLQRDLVKLSQNKNQITVLGLQHPDVITLGRRVREQNDIKSYDLNLPQVKTSRGGLATIHSLGQLVIYPVVNLRSLSLGIRDYVEILLTSTKSLLLEFGIETELDIKGAGLYTTTGKIAFCGIEVTEGITQHGISLNVRNDLNLFSAIVSCGIENLELDQMKNYQIDSTLEEIFEKWILHFKRNMNI